MTPLGFGTTRLTTNGITDWEQAAFQSNTEADGVRLQQLLSNMDLGLFLFSAAINFNRMNLRYRFFFFVDLNECYVKEMSENLWKWSFIVFQSL